MSSCIYMTGYHSHLIFDNLFRHVRLKNIKRLVV